MRELVMLEIRPSSALESQSGIQLKWPRIFGAAEGPRRAGGVAVVCMHPSSNFMNHPLMTPLAERGIFFLGLNSRFVNNDSILIMEHVLADLGAGVRHLRAQGFSRVVLLGWSGGAALTAFYQSQASKLTAHTTPAGDPTGLCPADLPPADAIALVAAHPGRSRLILDWIDPSLTDERDCMSVDPALDMYDSRNGPPYSADFLAHYREAQRARRARIEKGVFDRLSTLRAVRNGPRDEAFVIHRTHADPRFLDLSIDANDRSAGGLWGNPLAANLASNSIGRYTSLTAFASQWSSRSAADGPTHLARTDVPVLYLDLTADAAAFTSTRRLWLESAGTRASVCEIRGADHYLVSPPTAAADAADAIASWTAKL